MISKLFYLLTQKQKFYFYIIFFITFLMAIIEMIGIASIMPFIYLLLNPDTVETNKILKYLFIHSKIFGVETKDQFLFISGIAVLFLLIISICYRFLTYYIHLRFLTITEFTVTKNMMESYLHQPYAWFLNRHSSNIGKIILSDASKIMRSGFGPLLALMSDVMTSLFIIILLIFVDFQIAVIVGMLLGGSYLLIYILTKNFVNNLGIKIEKNTKLRFGSIFEAFNAVKEIKILGQEKFYIKAFSAPSKNLAKLSALSSIINQSPRYFLECIVFGGMMVLILFLINRSGNLTEILPVISLYAFAGYRLMPALQKIYQSVNQLILIKPTLDIIHNDLINLNPPISNQNEGKIKFEKKIVLKNLNYQYPNSNKKALENINLTIPVKSLTAFVGPTGCGKTTLIDTILSIILSKEGTLEVDGQIINELNSRSWRQNIGYVPQNIYLSDDTIAANIAFGVAPNAIDYDAVYRASKIANLDKFVENDLKLKYETTIGERGVRLSGGQRQRIGIARAIYNNPKVLVLDEATNSLDNNTEKLVMDAIYNLTDKMTVIMVAHRLNTIKGCDKIFYLEEGKLIDQGNFQELKQKKIISEENFFNHNKNKKKF